MMKVNYSVTLGYNAVFQIDVKAESEDDAKEIAKMMAEGIMKKAEYMKRDFSIAVSNLTVAGIVNNDESWNLVP